MFRSPRIPEPRKVLIAAISAASIICITLVIYFAAINKYQPTEAYDGARLQFNTVDPSQQMRYAVREDKGKFLFAAGAPNSVGSALFFHSTGNFRVRIQSFYNNAQCSAKGVGNAEITFITPVENYSMPLSDAGGELVLPVLAGDKIGVQISNHAEESCGRAMIWLSKDAHFVRYIAAFALLWFAALALLSYFKLGSLALWGAGIHAAYIISETLYGQALHVHIGLSALTALSGVGLVLTPLFSRYLKPVAFVLFIVATIYLLGLPLLNIGNYWAFNSPLDSNSIHAILQTNASELLQFLDDNFSGLMLLIVGLSFAALVILAGFLLRYVQPSFALSGLGILLLALSAGFYPQVSDNIASFKIWKNSTFSYFRELSAFRKLSDQRKELSIKSSLRHTGPPKVTVLVIGESHNKNHMSLYGYPRSTTPALDTRAKKGELVVLEKAYSNHTHTTPSLSLALTQANQYNSKNWFQAPSVLDLAKQSDIQTFWISNQQMLGAWDNKVALIAQEADKVVAINKKVGIYKQPNHFDEALLDPFKRSLENPGEKLIVIHLMGNHASYCLRYPEKWQNFSKELQVRRFGKSSDTSSTDKINCYDNSVLYNDFIMESIFALLEQSSLSASVYYFADHSEDIFGGKAHNQANFNFAMSEIPSYIWATKQWKLENPTLWSQLLLNRDAVFTNDLVFNTTLGLMGLQGESNTPENDLSAENYREPVTPVTLHGRVNIYSSENRKLWQRINARLVSKNHQSGRLVPHRVNTVGKMLDTVSAGLRSFEIDVRYTDEGSGGVFSVGHDSSSMSGMNLDEFLAEIPQNFTKIWLDLKNLRADNVQGVLSRLNELENRYSIKHRIIVESANYSAVPRPLVEEGYYLSYYIPTTKVLATEKESEQSRRVLAAELAQIVKIQQAGAVSFDLRLYGFVKEYLEPLLNASVEYHAWFPGVSFESTALFEKLSERAYFSDDRVKTILLPYSSLYSF